MSNRFIQHLPEAGISIGVDVNDGKAKLAVAAANTKDPFSRKAGTLMLKIRLNGDQALLRSFNAKKNVLSFTYTDNNPKKDILRPVADLIRSKLDLSFDSESKQVLFEGKPLTSCRINRSFDSVLRIIKKFIKENFQTEAAAEAA